MDWDLTSPSRGGVGSQSLQNVLNRTIVYVYLVTIIGYTTDKRLCCLTGVSLMERSEHLS